MIVFGARHKALCSKSINSPCKSCSSSDQTITVLQKYFHIFWIPVFPLNKISEIQCQNCRKITQNKEMDTQEKSASTKIRSEAKTPLYLFIGAILIAALFAREFYENKQDSLRTQALQEMPLEHDFAVFIDDKDQYQIIKVLSNSEDKVVFAVSKYLYRTLSAAKDAIKNKKFEKDKEFFSEDLYEMPMSEYKGKTNRFVFRD